MRLSSDQTLFLFLDDGIDTHVTAAATGALGSNFPVAVTFGDYAYDIVKGGAYAPACRANAQSTTGEISQLSSLTIVAVDKRSVDLRSFMRTLLFDSRATELGR
jgi:hypothetical protein